MIYVIAERLNREFIKIGYTRTIGETVNQGAVRKRLSGLQVSTWRELICIGACDGSLADEKALHFRFDSYRVAGEWFANRGEVSLWLESVKLPVAIEIVGRSTALASHENRMRMHTYLRNAKQRALHRERRARAIDPTPADPYKKAAAWVWRGKVRHG